MSLSENASDPKTFYSERYTEAVKYPLVPGHPELLQDHENDASRRCRFCGRGEPDVSFSNYAHAVPEFLGKNSLRSMNECDACNTFLAYNYEDDLSKWSLYPRALSQI